MEALNEVCRCVIHGRSAPLASSSSRGCLPGDPADRAVGREQQPASNAATTRDSGGLEQSRVRPDLYGVRRVIADGAGRSVGLEAVRIREIVLQMLHLTRLEIAKQYVDQPEMLDLDRSSQASR